MPTAEELIKMLNESSVDTYASEPEELVIDAESRSINIPQSERLFGVKGDMNIERKYFRCPKIVGDNIDLSTHQIFIAYVYTERETGSILPSVGVAPYYCEDVEVDGEDITFSWKLTGNVFKNPGFILFKMYAKKTETDPNTVFNTTPAIGTVLATIPDGTEEIVEEYPDVIAQIFDRLDALESGGGGGTGGTTNYENLSNKPQLNGVTLEGNKTLDQVGVLAKNQGSSNSGKFLSVGSDGNVVPADAPSGGTVDPEQIKQAVNGYLEENPVSGMTAEQEQQLNQNTTDVADLKSALPDKLDTNQGAENKGKSMVVGEDGGLVPENVKVNVDSTLSNEGEAADAKATGYELEKRLTKEDTIEQLENGPYKLQKKKIWDGAAENGADSPLFKVSDYIDVQVGGYSIFYKDDQSTVVREGWGTYSNIKGVYPEVSYVKVRDSTSSVQVCEKIYEYNKLKYIGKYDVLSSGEEVTDLVYKQSIATNYTEDDIDFSKPAKLNLRGNGQFRVYNIWNTVVLNLDNCSNTEFDFPDSSYKVMVNGFADGGTFTYHKKPESHTIPSLALIPENASNDFIRFLEKTLNISAGENPGESLEDLAEGRTLVWSEEFNKNSLDRKIWQYEIGTDRRGYLRNLNEHPEINAFVDSSNLNLRILRDHPRGSFSWSGSILRSTCGFQFLYGLIEAKIKFPSTGGYMSFWLMGENGVYSLSDTNSENETINEGYGWPKCGEMDIAESDGGKVSCTIHYQNEDKEHATINGNSNYSATSTQEYHIYGLEWTEAKMAVYLDRNLVKEFDISQCEVECFNPFNHPMNIVLSILNGDTSFIGTAPPSNFN